MDDREVASKPDQGILDASSTAAAEELDFQQATNRTNNELDSFSSTSINTLSITPESALIAKATQMRLHLFNSTTLCTSVASSSTNSTSPPAFTLTPEYAKMVLGERFKVSHCRTLQALKLAARVKCTRYNAAAADPTNEALLCDISNLTVDDLTAALGANRASQREQLLDLLGFVEPADADADGAMRLCNLAIDPPLGVFIGVNIHVGHEFYANAGVRIHDHAPVVIGRHVRLGPNVSLLTEEYDVDAIARRAGDLIAAPIEIGDDVWIGAGATVLGGVRIGNGAVVGAGSLVCKDVKAGEVVVGVPAKAVREKEKEKKGR